jgi:archaeosortase A (PGF-CTERM-specific)
MPTASLGPPLVGVRSLLDTVGGFAEPVGWLVLGLFLVGVVLEYVDREYARLVLVGAWGVFAVFWLFLIYPWFAIDNSVIRGVGAVVAVPLSVLVAKTLYEGRDSLFVLSRAVTVMGLVYAPFTAIRALREQLVLVVTEHTLWAMNLVGHDPPVVVERSDAAPYAPESFTGTLDNPIAAKDLALENTFVFFQDTHTVTYTIIIACTGIGSMAVIVGLVAAVLAPWRRKLKALALAVPIIYVLNIVRNVFIGLSFGNQWMQLFTDQITWLFGTSEAGVSYIWADRIIAQSASVVAMIAIFWLVVRVVPEVLGPVEDAIYLLTGRELDLAAALDVEIESTAEPVDAAD